jgi:drug/metabolite transporter (DMT)-like permease
MRPIYWFAMVAAAVGWASGGVGTRAAITEGVGEWTIVAMRILIAAVVVAGIIIARRIPRPSPVVVRYGLVQAVTNLTIPYVLFTFAYAEASAGFVSLLAALIPMSTAVFANSMLPSEPLTKGKFVGLFVAFAGVAALLLSGDSGLSEGGRPLIAVGLALAAVASVGYASSFAKRHAGEYDPTMLTWLQFAFSSLWLVAAMFAIEGSPTDVSGYGWALIVGMAFSATVLPFLLLFWLLQYISATDSSLIGYMVPLITIVGGIVLLGEQLQAGMIVGGVLVFIGIVIADRETRRQAVEPALEGVWPNE